MINNFQFIEQNFHFLDDNADFELLVFFSYAAPASQPLLSDRR